MEKERESRERKQRESRERESESRETAMPTPAYLPFGHGLLPVSAPARASLAG